MVQSKIRLNNQKTCIEQSILHKTLTKREKICLNLNHNRTKQLQTTLHNSKIPKQTQRIDFNIGYHR